MYYITYLRTANPTLPCSRCSHQGNFTLTFSSQRTLLHITSRQITSLHFTSLQFIFLEKQKKANQKGRRLSWKRSATVRCLGLDGWTIFPFTFCHFLSMTFLCERPFSLYQEPSKSTIGYILSVYIYSIVLSFLKLVRTSRKAIKKAVIFSQILESSKSSEVHSTERNLPLEVKLSCNLVKETEHQREAAKVH